MRTMNETELHFVSGAGDDEQSSIVERGVELCKGMPDDKTITITVDHKDSVGVGATKGSTTETITFEMTCGDLRESAEKSSS